MENLQQEVVPVQGPRLKLSPCLDSSLTWISKNRKPASVSSGNEFVHLFLKDALICSRLTQLNVEIELTNKHQGAIRITSRTKAVLAHEELLVLKSQLPELQSTDFTLDSEAEILAAKRSFIGTTTAYVADSPIVVFSSLQEFSAFCVRISIYSFYTSRDQRFPEEFACAEANMREVVEKYRLPGRYSWNKNGGGNARPKGKKVDLDFFKQYGTGEKLIAG